MNLIMKQQLSKIELILNELNNHPQDGDLNSHNSVRIINNSLVVLGQIVGTITTKEQHSFNNKIYTSYAVHIICEDDDFWFEGGSSSFDSAWLDDYIKVMQLTKTKLKEFNERVI